MFFKISVESPFILYYNSQSSYSGGDTMQATIKMIEDFSLNAWPSHQIQFYDGWLLRFSYFYTHRTNSVEQIGPSSIPLEEKIDFCEDAYRRWGTPSIFKITPLLPEDFEQRLIRRGYQVQHSTQVMLLDSALKLDLLDALGD